MYAGPAPSFFHGEPAAVMVGIAYAAADWTEACRRNVSEAP
ncbi:hypothetical protein ACIP8U_07300 [Streptomyces pseudovenezuelae]